MRNQARIRAELVSWGRIVPFVSSLDEETIDDLSVTLSLPRRPASITIQPELVTVDKPRYEATEADFLTLHIEDLLPHENRTYWIDMEYEEANKQ